MNCVVLPGKAGGYRKPSFLITQRTAGGEIHREIKEVSSAFPPPAVLCVIRRNLRKELSSGSYNKIIFSSS
jgi:hypothetical protein